MAATTDPAITPALLAAGPESGLAVAFAGAVSVIGGCVVVVGVESAVAVANVEVCVVVDADAVVKSALVCCGTSDEYTAWFLPIAQYGTPPEREAHSYPNGQHVEFPHDGRSESSAVVKIGLSGWLATSINPTSQVVGVIALQVCPAGQQRAVVLDASTTHLLPGEQQKLPGRP